jgi:hypothetical protein
MKEQSCASPARIEASKYLGKIIEISIEIEAPKNPELIPEKPRINLPKFNRIALVSGEITASKLS